MLPKHERENALNWYEEELERVEEAKLEAEAHLEERKEESHSALRWLVTVFQSQYLPSLSINYVAINKVLEKLPTQLY